MQNKHILNRLNSLEAKINALLEDAGIEDVEIPGLGNTNLYNIRVPNQESMGAVPKVEASEVVSNDPAASLPHRNTAPMSVQVEGKTVAATADSGLPLKNYDDMTVGEVMKAVKDSDLSREEAMTLRMYEQSHKDRSQVKDFLSSWNS